MAAGAVVTTAQDCPRAIRRIDFAWTSDGSGDVDVELELPAGFIIQAQVRPTGGATAPTDLYDLTLVDEHGADVLAAAGSNLSATLAEFVSFTYPGHYFDGVAPLSLVVANAGNQKAGALTLWMLA